MKTKNDLRRTVLELRKKKTPQEILDESRAVLHRLEASELYIKSACILTYVGFQGEVETRPLIEKAWEDGKNVSVPRVEGRDIVFCPLTDFSQLKEGTFHVPEPVSAPASIKGDVLVIVPGVAFDEKCNRIGYGKGFYDRYLREHPQYTAAALAFDWQIFDFIPHTDYDRQPDCIFTGTKTILKK